MPVTTPLSSVFDNADCGSLPIILGGPVCVKFAQVVSALHEKSAALQTKIILQGISDGYIPKWELLATESEANLAATIAKLYINTRREVALSFDKGRRRIGVSPLHNGSLLLLDVDILEKKETTGTILYISKPRLGI